MYFKETNYIALNYVSLEPLRQGMAWGGRALPRFSEVPPIFWAGEGKFVGNKLHSVEKKNKTSFCT